jgi:hypothetical protein
MKKTKKKKIETPPTKSVVIGKNSFFKSNSTT